MIFYFSGTGNSKWVAEKIAENIGDRVFDISSKENILDVENENYIGFVFPVYAWGAPKIMISFAQNLKKVDSFTFAICTCGENVGYALKKFSKVYRTDSNYSIVMPNNYIVGSDPDDKEEAIRKIKNAEIEIKEISGEIKNRKYTYRAEEGSFSWIKSGIVNLGFNKFARSTKNFYATEKCIGCGVCERNCPMKTIHIENGKPVWGKECRQCLKCINECPMCAIEYGKATVGRNRYNIGMYIDEK